MIQSLDLFEIARKFNKFNLEFDELDRSAADRLKLFCARENIYAEFALDVNPLYQKVSIPGVTFDTIEKIEAVLESAPLGH